MENKNSTISVLKGLAIALVIYGHLIQRVMVLRHEDFFLHPVFKIIYTFHMPLFVFISGFLLAESLSRSNIGQVFRKRLQGLMVPYLTWGTLGVITFFLIDVIDGKKTSSNLAIDWVNQLIIKPEVWFLSTLFICAALILLCVRLQKYIGLSAFVVVYVALVLTPYHQYGSFYYVQWFYLFYMAGYAVNRYGRLIVKKLNHQMVSLGIVLLFVVLAPFWTRDHYIYVNQMNFQGIGQLAYSYLIGFLGIAMMFFGGQALTKTPICGFWEWVGIYSLDIYLLQRYFVEGLLPRVLSRAGIEFEPFSPYFLLVFAPIMTLFSLMICIVVSKYFFRKFEFLNMLFLGKRK